LSEPQFRRELIRAANREPFHLNATEVSDLLDWFANMPGEIFNDLLHGGVEFPDGYVKCWLELTSDNGDTHSEN
jgi:hypothetical protein